MGTWECSVDIEEKQLPSPGGGWCQGWSTRWCSLSHPWHPHQHVPIPPLLLSQKYYFHFTWKLWSLFNSCQIKSAPSGVPLRGSSNLAASSLPPNFLTIPSWTLESSHPTIPTASQTSSTVLVWYPLHRIPSSQFLYLSKSSSSPGLTKIALRTFIWFPTPRHNYSLPCPCSYILFTSLLWYLWLENCVLHAFFHNLGVKSITQAPLHIVWYAVSAQSMCVWLTLKHTHTQTHTYTPAFWSKVLTLLLAE